MECNFYTALARMVRNELQMFMTNIPSLTKKLIEIISESNGVTLNHTLELLSYEATPELKKEVQNFQKMLQTYQSQTKGMSKLFNHPMADAFFQFFKAFPIRFHDQHIHLTGSLSADFIYPRISKLLEGPNREVYRAKIISIYGKEALPLDSEDKIKKLITLKKGDHFDRYLNILYLAKLILIKQQDYEDAAYHLATKLYNNYNIGYLRLKFTLSRVTNIENEQIPGIENLSTEDTVMGLYKGLNRFKKENPIFNFTLAPSFRKESDFFDSKKHKTKREHFNAQVESILKLIEKYPALSHHLTEVDTVGNEKDLYNKSHFEEMRSGFRKLQYFGFKIRSHHGETWHNLKKGIQAVDHAINIWRINTLEHGLSLGINPNYYMHRLFQKVCEKNSKGESFEPGSNEYQEIENLEWYESDEIKEKIITGQILTEDEKTAFTKVKFHTAREIEHYQHDVLNQMINKGISLTALPSSNAKLTNCFPDFKSHPFSWWERKGVRLGIGTDNYVTLSTNFIKELMILLFSDPGNLKITKLLMIATKEKRRPFISHLLWEMRKTTESD